MNSARVIALLLLLLTLAALTGARGRRHEVVDAAPPSPQQQNNTEVVAQLGGTAVITCYTYILSDEVVTWLKREPDALLTAGSQVYSEEHHYSVSHVRHQKMWELSVFNVRHSDAGTYECQLTSHPPVSYFFNLKVVEARAVLQGAPEVHVQTGESLRLHCLVSHATQQPDFIFWYHNGSMVNYKPRVKVVHHHYSSKLLIGKVTWKDAGTYVCEAHNARPANLTLHVVAGEKHAALHNGQGEGGEEASAGTSPNLLTASCLLLTLASLYLHHVSDTVWSVVRGASLW